jgi:hypothetical protein
MEFSPHGFHMEWGSVHMDSTWNGGQSTWIPHGMEFIPHRFHMEWGLFHKDWGGFHIHSIWNTLSFHPFHTHSIWTPHGLHMDSTWILNSYLLK